MDRRFALRGVCAAIALALAACHVQTSGLGSNDALNAQASTAYTQLALKQDEALLAQMSSRVEKSEVRAQLPVLQTLVPEGQPPAPVVKGNESYTGTDGRTYTVFQDYEYADRVNHVATRLIHEDDAWKVLSFNVNVTMKAPGDSEDRPAAAPPVDAPKP